MSAFKKIWNTFTTVVVVLVVILAILLVGVRLLGLQVYTVLSGSMEPAYQTGSLIYVKKVDARTLETGDVITFMMNEDTIATHRIAGVVPDEEDPDIIRYRTKGDANAHEDATLVHYKNVLGTPVFTIPKLGYFANFIQNPPGRYYAIAIVAILLLLSFLPDLFDEEKDEKKKKKSKSQGESLPCVKGGGSAKRRRRDCNSQEETTPVTTPQSSLHSDSSPYTGEPSGEKPKRKRPAPGNPASEPAALSETKNPPEKEKILRHKVPQADKAVKETIAPAAKEVAAVDRTGGADAPKLRRERKAPAVQETPQRKPKAAPVAQEPKPVRVSRPAPAAEETVSFDLDDILAEFRND